MRRTTQDAVAFRAESGAGRRGWAGFHRPSCWRALGAALIPAFVGMTLSAADPADWKTCAREAAKANPELAAARQQIACAEADARSVRSQRFPQVAASASYTHSDWERTDPWDNTEYGVAASQLLYDCGRARWQVATAEKARLSAECNYQYVSAEVRLKLRAAFVELLRVRELVTITTGILDRRKEHTALVELRYNAGREHKGALLTAQAREAQARFELAQAGRAAAFARTRLALLMGVSANPDGLDVRGRTDDHAVAEGGVPPDFAAIADLNPVVSQFAAEVERAKCELRATDAQRYPSLSTSAEVGRSESSVSWEDSGTEWSVGVSLSVPLYAGGKIDAEIRVAQARVREAEANWSAQRSRVIELMQGRWIETQDSAENVEVRSKFLVAAAERARISGAQYAAGGLPFDTWIIIEDDYAVAEKALLDARAQALAAEARWLAVRGRTVEDEIR